MANISKYRNSWLAPFGDFLDADDFWNKSWMPRAFNNHPAVNIAEKENEFTVELAAPGYKKEDFKVSAEDGMLTVSAETKQEKKEDGKEYTRKEYSCSSFQRSFQLPDNVKEDDINAKYEDGILKLQIPKKTPGPAKQKKEITVG